MKIFQMNDCDWWIGPSLEACVADYIEETGEPESVEDANELSDQELDTLMFQDTDELDVPSGSRRTFREQLAREIEAGGEFPRMFASTEY